MFDVITVGGATRDVFFVTSKGKIIREKDEKYLAFKYGAKIIPEDSLFTYGGGGANTAISFAKLGLKTATVLNIGAEGTGSLIVKDLDLAGVNTEFISRDRKNHTAMSIIVSLKSKDHAMFLYRGANDFLSVQDWRPLKTKWFYLSSLTGESTDVIPELFSYARAHGIKVAWNPGSEQLEKGFSELENYLEETDILILNLDEAKQLAFSREGNPKVKAVEEILGDLYEMTGKLVVVTDGGK
jgi:sugar/nucleoside kinase (ribokinase family)